MHTENEQAAPTPDADAALRELQAENAEMRAILADLGWPNRGQVRALNTHLDALRAAWQEGPRPLSGLLLRACYAVQIILESDRGGVAEVCITADTITQDGVEAPPLKDADL